MLRDLVGNILEPGINRMQFQSIDEDEMRSGLAQTFMRSHILCVTESLCHVHTALGKA